MAVTGLVMVGYLLLHMYGNLKIFSGKEKFDHYAHSLRTFGEPVLPYEGLLWIIRVVLVVSVTIHIIATVTLWRRARAATGRTDGRRYQSTKAPRGVQRSYASFTMRWGGVIIVLFLIYHLLHLTWNSVAPGGASDSPFERLVNGFTIWWVLLSYVVAMAAVGFHLRHGFWAALADLGANTSPGRRRVLSATATVLASLIVFGFLLPAFAIFFGWVS